MGWGRCSFSGQRNSVTLLKDSDKTSFQMEGRVKMGSVFVVLVMLGSLDLGPKSVECAFSIQLNPCTLSQCIAECKKALPEKYLSATCATGSQGKFCICLG
ncbi:hypothetical protein OIU79_029476 [Salix purpurea]|uniref:Uncharacterized protein n=1 Tax=Salix purpurea TaxID=77065 RepID=A0A9Q0VGF0_SALPP|nr:hypothetical protein OIU79_029476 [Salix purpurea]